MSSGIHISNLLFTGSIIDWMPAKQTEENIPFEPGEKGRLLLRTDSSLGSGDKLLVEFKDKTGEISGGFRIKFDDIPKFTFMHCLDFEENLDYSCLEENGDKIIAIIKIGHNMKVYYQINMFIFLMDFRSIVGAAARP